MLDQLASLAQIIQVGFEITAKLGIINDYRCDKKDLCERVNRLKSQLEKNPKKNEAEEARVFKLSREIEGYAKKGLFPSWRDRDNVENKLDSFSKSIDNISFDNWDQEIARVANLEEENRCLLQQISFLKEQLAAEQRTKRNSTFTDASVDCQIDRKRTIDENVNTQTCEITSEFSGVTSDSLGAPEEARNNFFRSTSRKKPRTEGK